jgi:hypothetical protein
MLISLGGMAPNPLGGLGTGLEKHGLPPGMNNEDYLRDFTS